MFLDFKAWYMSFIIQERSCSLSTKVNWSFYAMTKIRLNMIKCEYFYLIWVFTLKLHEILPAVYEKITKIEQWSEQVSVLFIREGKFH